MSRRAWRHVHLDDGAVWDYRIGSGTAVLRSPEGEKKVVPLHEIKGIAANLVERGRWKGTSDGMILPSEVKTYIQKEYR